MLIEGNIMYSFKVLSENKVSLCDVIRIFPCKNEFDLIAFLDGQTFDMQKEMTKEAERFLNTDSFIAEVGFVHLKKDVKSVMDNFLFSSNLVWELPCGILDEDKNFNLEKWRWCYFCADDSWVELFTPLSDYAAIIEQKFKIERIEYPGSIFSYLNPHFWD
jgi:hypothetical protein